MGKIKVTLSANAGVCIEAAGKRVWVDMLHSSPVKSFSTMSKQLQEWVLSWDAPDYICYTHCHGDHYSRELTRQAVERWPKAKVILPRQDFADQVLLCEQKHMLKFDDITMEFFRLVHEGAEFANVPHYGMILTLPEGNVLLPGDCAVASSALADAIGGRNIDVAVLDFPWITLRKGRQFLSEHICAKHVLVCHLPFAEDDCNSYRECARRAALQMKNVDVRLLLDPKQSEEINN